MSRYRSAVEREREQQQRQQERRESARFGRVLKAEATMQKFEDALTAKFGPEHGTRTQYDADSGWFSVERNGKKAHYHIAELDKLADKIYAELHEREIGGDAD